MTYHKGDRRYYLTQGIENCTVYLILRYNNHKYHVPVTFYIIMCARDESLKQSMFKIVNFSSHLTTV